MAAKKKTPKKIEEVAEAPKPMLVPLDHYSLVVSREEVLSAVQILSFAQHMFEQMAVEANKDGDAKATSQWAARAKLSVLLYTKFRDVANIGEPDSTELH
jgi:hypothetical protein